MNCDYVFLLSLRDFHGLDWYRSAVKLYPNKSIEIITDLREGEGLLNLTNSQDKIVYLFMLDKFLFSSQTPFSNIWRNFLKILLIPFQIYRLKKYTKTNSNSIYFAHGIYYSFLLSYLNVKYVSTPQGSEILIRIQSSKFYKLFCKKALYKALVITVDSIAMKDIIEYYYNLKAEVVQNGIDVNSIINTKKEFYNVSRNRFLSVRGFTPLYRIKQIFESRNFSSTNSSISFSYPFYDTQYKNSVSPLFSKSDVDLGYLSKEMYYRILVESRIVFSIPISDSSPRSVYEAIFSGCIVVITSNPYLNMLPASMRERIIVIEIEDKNWFEHAVIYANEKLKSEFIISSDLKQLYDQNTSFDRILKLI